MLKKIFISAVLLIAVLSFVVSLLGGNNNNEPKVAVGDRVAVINISGPIVDGASVEQTLLGGTQAATSGQLMKEIRDAAADSSVKALVLHINSPGGSVTAAEEVGRELERFKETTKKPIVTSCFCGILACFLQRRYLCQFFYPYRQHWRVYALYEC